MPLQPLPDYSIGLTDPAETLHKQLQFAQGVTQAQRQSQLLDAQMQENALKMQEAQRKAAQAQAQEQAIEAFAQNPTLSGAHNLIARYPPLSEPYKPIIDKLTDDQKQAVINQRLPLYSLMLNGKIPEAIGEAEVLASGFKNAGKLEDEKVIREAIAQMKTNPAVAMDMIGGPLAVAMGHQNFEATFAPTAAKRREQEAKAGIEEDKLKAGRDPVGGLIPSARASAKRDLTQAEQNAASAANLRATGARTLAMTPGEVQEQGLKIAELQDKVDNAASERERAKAELDLKKARLDFDKQVEQRLAGKLPPSTLQSLKELTPQITEAKVLESKANEAAEKVSKLTSAGAPAKVREAWKAFWGTRDGESQARDLAARIRKGEIMRILGPLKGSTSDRDLVFAMDGEPPNTDNPKIQAQYMRGLAKMASLEAKIKTVRKEWLSANHSDGTAEKAFKAGGFNVEPGDTLESINDKILAPYLKKKNSGPSWLNY